MASTHSAVPADLILLKLYAGGSQDAWDIEQLLTGPERAAVTAEIEATLGALPAERPTPLGPPPGRRRALTERPR